MLLAGRCRLRHLTLPLAEPAHRSNRREAPNIVTTAALNTLVMLPCLRQILVVRGRDIKVKELEVLACALINVCIREILQLLVSLEVAYRRLPQDA